VSNDTNIDIRVSLTCHTCLSISISVIFWQTLDININIIVSSTVTRVCQYQYQSFFDSPMCLSISKISVYLTVTRVSRYQYWYQSIFDSSYLSLDIDIRVSLTVTHVSQYQYQSFLTVTRSLNISIRVSLTVTRSLDINLVRRCGVVGSTHTFGSIGHGFESEHRLFSHHSASSFSKLRSLAKCSLDDSVRRLL